MKWSSGSTGQKSRVLSLLLVCVQISNRSIYVRSTHSCTFLMHVTPSYFSPQLWMYAKKLSPSCSTQSIPTQSIIGPLQVSIHVVQNRHFGTQTSHCDKTNKGNYRLKLCMPFVGLAPMQLLRPNIPIFHPHEWKPAKG